MVEVVASGLPRTLSSAGKTGISLGFKFMEYYP